MHELRMGVCYDFRNPPDSGVSDQTLYAEILDQVRWLDRIGADLVWFSEHHFVEESLQEILRQFRGARDAQVVDHELRIL